jgi:hypothetical protein
MWQFYNNGYSATAFNGTCEKSQSYYSQDFQQHRGICCACTKPPSPLVFDVRHEGYHLTATDDGVTFDFFGSGKPIRLSWTDARYHNAWLALDRDGDGKITTGKELFGNITPQPVCGDGTSKRYNGWRALAVYDDPKNGGNGDGVIDKHDAIYSKLLLWIDKNHDGISQPNELYHLSDLGVEHINLKYDPGTFFVDAFGNQFDDKGSWLELLDPDHTAYDVYLKEGIAFRKASASAAPAPECVY